MVPAVSDGVPPAPPYSGSRFGLARLRLRASHPLRGPFPGASPRRTPAYSPRALLPRRGLDPSGLGSSAFARHYRRNHACSPLLPLLGCFGSRRSPRLPQAVRGLQPRGFPHSDTPGSPAICASPGLFAACRVLPRLREPRHPPCALPQSPAGCARGGPPPRRPGLLPLSSPSTNFRARLMGSNDPLGGW